MKTRINALSILIIALLLILVFGCKKEKEKQQEPDPTPPTYTNGEGEIGSIGGTITIDDTSSPLNGVIVKIPEGALTSNKYITISPAPNDVILSEDSTAQIISFQPSGLKFNKPIEIGLPTNSDLGFNDLELINFDLDSSIITELHKTRLANKILYAETDHFSYYLVFKKNVYTAIEMQNINGYLAANVRIGSRWYGEQQGLRWIPNLIDFALLSGSWNVWGAILDNNLDEIKLVLRVTLYEGGFWGAKRVAGYGIVVERNTFNLDEYGVKVFVPWNSEPIFTSNILSQVPFEEFELFLSGYPLIFYFDDEHIPKDDIEIQIDPNKRYFVKSEWEFNIGQVGDFTTRITKKYKSNNSDEAQKLSEMESYDYDVDENFIVDDYQDNNSPEAKFTVTPNQGDLSTNFKFDASLSSDEEDPSEELKCRWDFEGDGVWDTDWSNSKIKFHQYSNSGNYSVKLIVKDTEDASDTKTESVLISEIGEPPIADFTAEPTSGTAPLIVYFTDLSSNNPTSWNWDFGDGGSSSEKNPSHTYNNADTYNVDLTVENEYGLHSIDKIGFITVNETGEPPIADFSAEPTSGTVPLNVNFTDLSINNPTSWSWDFGDGGASSEQNPTYVYNNPGDYTVSLIVTNTYGNDQELKNNFIAVVGNGGEPCPGLPTITYGGQVYNTVQIGNQCWLKENLNIGSMILGSHGQTDNNIIEKYCHDNYPSNCDVYGGLYQWDEMMQYTTQEETQGICPDGWHLPTDDEWKIAEMFLGMSQSEADETGWRGTDEGKKLKSISGWYNDGNGIDEVGFAALPGGYRIIGGSFSSLGEYGSWWSSTEYSGYPVYAWYRQLYYEWDRVYRKTNYGIFYKESGYSVRCIKD